VLRYVIEMRKLSTNLTFFWRVYAIAWILFFSISAIYQTYIFLISGYNSFKTDGLILFILLAFISSIIVHFIVGKLKNVFLDGDSLVISNYLKQIRVRFSEISHIDNPDLTSLRRIRIILHEPSEFGQEIVFAPPMFEAKETAQLLKSKIETNYLSL